jgi:hypothetical protein
VFPSPRTTERPLSDNAITAALRRIGYTGEQMSWHGFRAMASTLLNETGYPPDVIELQLAHQERSEVRAAYNRAQRLEERRKMMQSSKGTRCCWRIFMRCAAIRHSAACRSISAHSAARSSPGRTRRGVPVSTRLRRPGGRGSREAPAGAARPRAGP